MVGHPWRVEVAVQIDGQVAHYWGGGLTQDKPFGSWKKPCVRRRVKGWSMGLRVGPSVVVHKGVWKCDRRSAEKNSIRPPPAERKLLLGCES